MTRLIAECSFDYQGKTYEYEVSETQAHEVFGHFDLSNHSQGFNDLYALTKKTEPFPDMPSPKEFSVVRVQRIKPYEEKEFSGELKKIHHLFFR